MEFATLQEVLDFAVDKEENSWRLYHNAAQRTRSVTARKMFEGLAEQESWHKRHILALDPDRIRRYSFSPVPDLRISDYLAEVPYHDDMTFQEILIFSMKEEERSYRLYMQAETMTRDDELKRLLLMLAHEEKKHKYHLESMYDDKVLSEI